MTYQLPGTKSFPAELYAENMILSAKQFHADIPERYFTQYEAFWHLNREGVTKERLQAILDRAGIAAVKIITNAGIYMQGLVAGFPQNIPVKYRESPYEWTIDDVTFTDGTTSPSLTSMQEFWGLAIQHGYDPTQVQADGSNPTDPAARIVIGELKPDWVPEAAEEPAV